MKSFGEAAKVYLDLHSVAEVGNLLTADKAQINDPAFQQKNSGADGSAVLLEGAPAHRAAGEGAPMTA
jgi:hypothetical protein